MKADRDPSLIAKPQKTPRKKAAAKSAATAETASAAKTLAPAAPKAVASEFDSAAENFSRFIEQGQRVLAAAVNAPDYTETQSELAVNVADATRTFGAVVDYWLKQPERAASAQADLITGLTEIWSQTLHRFAGENVPPVVPQDPSDKRFAAPEWSQNPFFDYLRQTYSFATRWASDMVEHAEGLDPQTRAKAAFYTRLVTSSVSPSNFVATNPELLQATLKARGANLVRGMEMLAEDLSAGGGKLKIRQTDQSKFELGVDLATTPGKVVFRNHLMELIQYSPTTEEVYARPLLIVPPWINKFYVLDLNREKSFVRWAVAQGLTVFMISWVNPDVSKADLAFDDYMTLGLLAALDAIERATGEKRVAAAGYCVGGTLLAATLAYMAAKNDKRVDSVTFFATQVDFTEAGDMQIFVDEAKLAALEDAMAKTGYLEGVKMANTFNMLRPNELVWNYIVNNYVKGETPSAFDLLAWNSDSTRIPRANHSFYLRSCYLENRLTRGEMVLGGQKLDLGKVKIPVYEIATKDDHIAPARSVFRGAQYFGGEVTYILGGAGHIAGIINPPSKEKYQYWVGGPAVGTYEEWVKNAREIKGSWWPEWIQWLTKQAPAKVAAREPGGGKLEPICDAPGEYVRVKA
ncbi:MAG TPA: class I poly(R)-hydroxyalkanoic acid synthase [Methylocystis sp.]|nr:class I poly(R)-hydroxyalkanoic acid synthase [Methylocystis sp.]